MAGGAGAAHVAGVLNVDMVIEQRLAYGGTGRRTHLGTLRAVFWVRQYFDDWHVLGLLDFGFKPIQCFSRPRLFEYPGSSVERQNFQCLWPRPD